MPFAYWLDGYATTLKLPGKAMLLIMLKETQGKPSCSISIERVKEWYGISERTAERGYRELAPLLQVKGQKVRNPEVRGGYHTKVHRALRTPFSTADEAEGASDVPVR